uniref:Uncharacterized protein n=1 Tax=Panagrolaimus superbus TaxID=310955 RepID=A0A914YJJ3_9BILA
MFAITDVASEADEIEVSQSVHEDIIAPSAQLNNQVVERESDAVAARTIIVVESLTVQFEENKEEECEKNLI